MARAFVLGVIGAAWVLSAPVAMAGGAPVAYYPSLGYGQSAPDYGPDYGPPPAYAPPPAYGPPPAYPPPAYDRGAPPPPPERYERRGYDEGGYGADRRETYESRSEFEAGYDSGWRPAGGDRSAYDQGGAYAYDRERQQGDERAYAASSRQEYDYDSGWRIRELGPAPQGAPMCPYARPEAPPPPRPVCPSAAYYDHRFVQEGEYIPDTFFADTGGVGPDELEWGGGGGGGYVVGGASAGAFAEASASASANVSVGVRLGRHGGGHHGGGHMPHGCGCRK